MDQVLLVLAGGSEAKQVLTEGSSLLFSSFTFYPLLYLLIPPLVSVTQISVSRLRYLDLFNPTDNWILHLDAPWALSKAHTELVIFSSSFSLNSVSLEPIVYPKDPSQTPECPFNLSIPFTSYLVTPCMSFNSFFHISLVDPCPLILAEAALVQVLVSSHLDHHNLFLLLSCG